jgi:AhpD family alkylhydroperoxidase
MKCVEPERDRGCEGGGFIDGDEQCLLSISPYGRQGELRHKAGTAADELDGEAAGSKVDFELYCLAVSAINGCEMCIRSHEQVVIEGGLSEDQVHDAVRHRRNASRRRRWRWRWAS